MSAAAPPPDAPFDPVAERAGIATTLLRSAGRLMMGRDERSVVAAVCRALTQASPHIPVAWTWFGPVDAEYIVPDVCVGRAADYARTLVIRRKLHPPRDPCPISLDGMPQDPFHVPPASLYGPWRQAAERHGIRHALALPLPSGLAGTGGIFVVYADRPDYFSTVGVTLFEALAEVLGSVLTLSAERKELEHADYHDELTGLLNRNAQALVERRLQRDAELCAKTSVLLLDLDHFRQVDDQRGHGSSDQALRAVAKTLRRSLRRGEEALRWGNGEFLVLLPGAARADALRVAEKLRRAVMDACASLGLTCSIGVAELTAQESLLDAVTRAGAALVAAQEAGRNRVHTN
jgi:diguanylate cyclase (GGDEF)-like protein